MRTNFIYQYGKVSKQFIIWEIYQIFNNIGPSMRFKGQYF